MSYAKSDSPVSTQWLVEHLEDPNLRIIEIQMQRTVRVSSDPLSDEDVLLFESGQPEGSAAQVETKAKSWFRRELRLALTQAAFVFTGVTAR